MGEGIPGVGLRIYSRSHWNLGDSLNFKQSIACATDHWKQRALRAEYLLTLIPIPPQRAATHAPGANEMPLK